MRYYSPTRESQRPRITHNPRRPAHPPPARDEGLENICRLEPELTGLLAEARELGVERRDWGFSRIWTYDIKPKLRRIIGWNREDKGGNDLLRSSESFEIATRALVTAIETGTTYPVQGSEKR